MEIFRVIYLKDIKDLELENIGNHWTIDEDWAWLKYDVTMNSHLFDTDISEYKKYLIVCDINSDYIDRELTEEANNNIPSEKEVTTIFNTNIKLLLEYTKQYQIILFFKEYLIIILEYE